MAKEIGLGHCGAVEPSPPAIEPPVTPAWWLPAEARAGNPDYHVEKFIVAQVADCRSIHIGEPARH
jgi:hypothetical protein